MFVVSVSSAATFDIADGDVAALSNAILVSNSNGQDDTINLAILGLYSLTTQLFTTTGFDGLPRIEADGGHSLTINGFATIERSTAGATPAFRIFDVAAGANLTLNACGIKNGKATGVGGSGPQYDEGGGICNRGGTVTLLNCSLVSNSAVEISPNTFSGGGAIANLTGAALLARSCYFTNNSSSNPGGSLVHGGGAISNLGVSFALENCTFSGNTSAQDGGAIRNYTPFGNTVSISDSTFSGNTAAFLGGAIQSAGDSTITLTRCTFSGNSGKGGGAIYNSNGATYNMAACVFTNNSASTSYGGGAVFNGKNVTATACTFNGNSASVGDGGAIYNASGGFQSFGAATTLSNCTFSGNSAVRGGGITNSAESGYIATLSLINCTFVGNAASQSGGGVYCITIGNNATASVETANTVFKSGSAGTNLARANFAGESITSQGNNLSNDAAGGDGTTGPSGFLNASGDKRNLDPQLGALASNGGATQTHALLAGSPAIDAGNDGIAPHRDQRGYLRTGPSDIGAFEYNASFLRLVSIARTGPSLVNISVSCEVVQSQAYRLGRKLNIPDANWQSLAPTVPDLVATGNDTESITDPSAINLGKAFYRVRLLP